MKVLPTALPGVVIVEPRVFEDQRGFLFESYHAARYAAAGLPERFVQDNHSRSLPGTLRGLHYQLRQPQGKLIRVVAGSVFDVAVDIRRGSPTFGRWVGVELSAANKRQLYIPPGFAHGYCVPTAATEVASAPPADVVISVAALHVAPESVDRRTYTLPFAPTLVEPL